MPSLVLPISEHGIIVSILVRPGEEQAKALRDAGMAVPEPVRAFGFLDTGANTTMIDPGIVVGMKSANGYKTLSIGTDAPILRKGYYVDVAIADAENEMRWFPVRVMSGQTHRNGATVCLGTDFLANLVMHYDGLKKQATVTWE